MSESEMTAALRVGQDEGASGYRRGGYHPVRIGDRMSNGRYTILSKIGWGHFSTVWEAFDATSGNHVALKVVKSAPQYTDAARDEISIMNKITTTDIANDSCCVHLLDSFTHDGPNGTRLLFSPSSFSPQKDTFVTMLSLSLSLSLSQTRF